MSNHRSRIARPLRTEQGTILAFAAGGDAGATPIAPYIGLKLD